ncbi:hypothetical protein EON63_23125 [archaeon]|nr:MAG: hypothetical protein EON63_23125 [archaeon]
MREVCDEVGDKNKGTVLLDKKEVSDEQDNITLKALRRPVQHDDIPIPGVADCYILHKDTEGCSDHCSIVLNVRIG